MDAASSAQDELRTRFEAVALPLMAVVYRTALRLTHQPDDARDVTQETFLRAFRTFHGFQSGTNCKAWLLTIAHSVFVNRYRRQQRDPVVAVDDIDLLYDRARATMSPGPTLPAFANHISDPDIDAALSGLPEVFRSVVVLVDIEELTYDEAATVLACPVNTVRSRLFRGRKLLWTALREYAGRQGYPIEGAARGSS